jgi:hypothetical protein
MKDSLRSSLRNIGARSLGDSAARIVLAHNLVQAIPWLIALAASAGAGVYGALSSSHLIISLAAGVAAGSLIALAISLGSWYMAARKDGWQQISKEKDQELAERDLDAEDVRKYQLPLQLILDFSTHPLVIRDPLKADETCERWLRWYVTNNLDTLAPGIQIGVLNWTDGMMRVACGGNLPPVFDRVLPKPTDRNFSQCLDEIAPKAERLLLFEDDGAVVAEWLIVIAQEELDLGAEAFIGFVRQALAAARRALLTIERTGVSDGDE